MLISSWKLTSHFFLSILPHLSFKEGMLKNPGTRHRNSYGILKPDHTSEHVSHASFRKSDMKYSDTKSLLAPQKTPADAPLPELKDALGVSILE